MLAPRANIFIPPHIILGPVQAYATLYYVENKKNCSGGCWFNFSVGKLKLIAFNLKLN